MKCQRRQWAINTALFLIILIVMLLLGEIYFRIFYTQALYDECDLRNPDGPTSRVMPDKLFGHITKPNGTWCLYQPDTNKKIIIHTNSKGLRGITEYNYTKPHNTLRIATIGDSFIWGENLNDTQTMSAQLQKKIQQKLNSKYQQPPTVEIIPFGAVSYGTVQAYLLYKEEASKYQPDIVMYFYYQNDLTDSFTLDLDRYPRPILRILKNESNESTPTYTTFLTPAEYHVADERKKKPEAFPLYSNPNNARKKLPRYKQILLGNSHVFSFVNHVLARMQLNKETNREKLDNDVVRLMITLSVNQRDLFELQKKIEPQFAGMTKDMEVYLTIFNAAVETNNQEFVLVNIPSAYQIKDRFINVIEDDKKDFEKKKKETNPEYIESGKLIDKKENYFLRKVSAENNISYIDLSPVADQYQDSFYQSDDHWNPRGVEVSAKYVAEQLVEQGLLEKKKKEE